MRRLRDVLLLAFLYLGLLHRRLSIQALLLHAKLFGQLRNRLTFLLELLELPGFVHQAFLRVNFFGQRGEAGVRQVFVLRVVLTEGVVVLVARRHCLFQRVIGAFTSLVNAVLGIEFELVACDLLDAQGAPCGCHYQIAVVLLLPRTILLLVALGLRGEAGVRQVFFHDTEGMEGI